MPASQSESLALVEHPQTAHQCLTSLQVVQSSGVLLHLEADEVVGSLLPGVVSLGSHAGKFRQQFGSCLCAELDGVVEFAFGQSVLHTYPRGAEVGLHELLVLVLLLQPDHSPAGEAEEVEDEFLGVDVAAVALLAHVVVDGRPVLAVLGHQFQQQVRLHQRPLLLLLALQQPCDGGVDLLLLPHALLLLILQRSLLLILLLPSRLLGLLLPLLAALLPASAFTAFLAGGIEAVIDGDLLEVVVGEEEGEVVLAVAAHAEHVLVLLLGEGRVLGVHVLHDVGDLPGVQTAAVLEPHQSAVDAAVVAEGTQLASQSFQYLSRVVGLGPSEACGQFEGQQFLLAVGSLPHDMCATVGLQC